jgi:hypothetical protein
MIGWKNADKHSFTCSCGKHLTVCPFFALIAAAFKKNGLAFDPTNFGTGYRLVKNERLNRYLTEAVPYVHSSPIERLRDTVIAHMPMFSELIKSNNFANLLFIRTALAASRARVFVDVTKNPYRLRYLSRLGDLDLKTVYLIRDLRGYALSVIENRGWDAITATRTWLREQLYILRILTEFSSVLKIHYEDLCDNVDTVLAETHRFVGVKPQRFSGNFKDTDHHILGNAMRLQDGGRLVKSNRWQQELSPEDLSAIRKTALSFAERNKRHPLSDILGYYLD